MRNKKAWLRILEAFIAIILIASVLIILYSRTIGEPEREEEIYKIEQTILEEIASAPELRDAVLNNELEKIKNFSSSKIPFGFEFDIKICEVERICELGEYKEEVYSSERIISSTLQQYSPKKVKIFVWREK